MLDADQLTSLRVTLNASLPGTVIISRPSVADDGAGGQITAYSAAGAVSGRASPRVIRPKQEEPSGNDAVTARRDFIFTLPSGTDVRVTDHLLYAGGTYEISGLDNPRSYSVDIRIDTILRSS